MVEIHRIGVNTPNLKDFVYMTEQAYLLIKALQNFSLKPLGSLWIVTLQSLEICDNAPFLMW